MKKKIKFLYYLIIFIIFITISQTLNFMKFSDKNISINEILYQENQSLKEEIKELSEIDYNNYNYILGKITIKNLYNSDVYYIDSNYKIDSNLPVISANGLVGLTNEDNTMRSLKNITLSVSIDEEKYILKNSKIITDEFNGNIGDLIKTSGLTSIPKNLSVGIVKNIIKEEEKYIIDVEVNQIITNYVAVIKGRL